MQRTTMIQQEWWDLRAEATWGNMRRDRTSSHSALRTISCGGRW